MRRQRVKVANYRGKRRETGQIRLVLAVVLVLVGLVLILVRGWGMRFSGFLLLGTAALLALSVFLDRQAGGERCWQIVRRVFYGVLTLALAVLISIEMFVIQEGMRSWSALPTDAVVVLGAGVNGTTPSMALRTRLDAALDYLEQHPDIPAVLTGGQGYGEDITEAQCMYDWLTAHGVDGDRLILEEQATNTAENFAYSSSLLEARGIDTAEDSVAVVTNDFHVARTRLAAQKAGYGATLGIPAKLPWKHLSANYYLREAFAVVKTVIFD